MKLIRALFPLAMGVFLFAANSTPAAVISTDTAIGALDTSYDGTDLVVSNCIVTVDGQHSFNSLLVTNGGVLTHTAWSNGSTTLYFNVTNEPQVLTGTNPVTLVYSNVSAIVAVTDYSGLVTYTNDVDYVQAAIGGQTQIYRTETSAIPDGATVLVTYTWSYSYNAGLFLNVTNDLAIASNGSITANGTGYGPALGTGRGFSSGGPIVEGSGASHAGRGGNCSSNATVSASYGSLYQPTTLGSGGGASYAGPGGAGGGRIQITAGGTVSVDGVISANGADATNSRAGGGSGGSIWIIATNFTGLGSLTANGGAGEPIHGGGGGGGRISVQCATNNFSGSFSAIGGMGWVAGGAGSIFTQTNDPVGLLVLDNGGHSGTNSSVNLPTTADVVIRGGASVIPSGTFSPRDLTIATNSTLTGLSQNQLNLTVSGNLLIQAGGALKVDTLGYAGGAGTGPGSFNTSSGSPTFPCGGGGHGGYGAAGPIISGYTANGGITYGSQTAPTTYGSGGGNISTSIGGAGGGAVQLFISGTLQVDGKISANGGNGSGTGGGGGAGGSIYIQSCGALTGSGSITANGGGGVAASGGGGGGGRIAINATSNTFTGTISAAGGGGYAYGGAGTIYTQFGGVQQLTADNAGHLGTNTLVQSLSSAALIIRDGAKVTTSSSLTFNSLLVSSNGWLTHTPASSLNLTINGNATLQPGGGFLGDFCGRSGGQGSSPGAYYYITAPYVYYVCGGGSYGGKGGNSVSNYASGGTGTIADTAGSPIASYSGSGGGGLSSSYGGYGGGFLQMTVSGTLQHDGVISVNGGNGYGVGGGGGGAGGGIYLTAGKLAGSGVISANGGNGANNLGGGGGGGRIAIYFNSNNFTGTLAAFGGGGANWGGSGTIYLRTNANSRALVIADNSGHPGAGTLWNSSSTTDLILRNGSSCYVSSSVSFGDLTIGSNSWLIASNIAPSSATISAANVIIQPGGGISADLSGYNANSSYITPATYSTTSPYYPGGGGGHGGGGGYGLSGLSNGGGTFDSSTFPTYAGGGGAGYSTYSIGGKGGGVIILNAGGSLQVDGTLSANGGNGSGTGGGGGAGGSLKLSCATLTGTGSLNANGGNGVTGVGGGGAGGMIYASFYSNSFSGNLSAFGGGGYSYGGAGTVLLRTNTTTQTLVLIDNAGHVGMATPAPSSSSSHVVVRGGAYAYFSSPSSSTLASLLITSNAWLGGTINLTVTGNATIQPGGTIYADGVGSPQYTSGNGLGGFSYTSPYYAGTGGSHGGNGGMGSATSYSTIYGAFDSTTAPSSYGGGGGGNPNSGSIGGSGGGYVRLTVNGTLQLDGTITANGANGTGNGGGGGAGGGIYLTVAGAAGPSGTFSGSGTISANGGNGAPYGGGGGGGRIAVYYNSNNFTGKISAFGGAGYAYGGAGTIYTRTNMANYGLLLLDNAGNPGTNTSFDFINMDVTVQNRAIGLLPASGGWSAHDILIRTNSALVAPASSSTRALNFNSLTIDPGGVLTADAAGYGQQSGTGAGIGYSSRCGGAGHGGYGGGNPAGGGKAYDSITAPTTPGSGGAGYYNGNGTYNYGNGGGALTVAAQTVIVNGRLSVDGGNAGFNGGGGSGGSLFLQNINNLAGNGVISANGGSTTGSAGGGGGGRIALTCNSNAFTGLIMAYGGNALFPGGAGTIYTRFNNLKTLTVDNGGLAGTNTPLDTVNFSLPPAPFDLNISGAAVVVPVAPLPLVSNLNLAAGSSIVAPAPRSQLVIAVSHDANLAGSISLDNLGFMQTNGPGAGTNVNNKGSGGGYGGAGGNSASGATGGTTYGSALQPVDFGSGGGTGANTSTGGSEGGGAVRLSVGGTLNIDGNLSADGAYGWQDDSGGGAGGSIWISANTLTGLGTISAAGGDGDYWNGGGGGGGRIAIYSPTNLFAGVTNLDGGLGAANGQPGTLFLAATPVDFLIGSQSPTGTVSNTVSYVDLFFNEAVDPASVSTAAFTLTTPAGVMDTASLSASTLNWAPSTVRVSFPVQNLLGNYSLQVAAVLTNILGQPLMQAFTGNFTIALPMISGTVSDTNGTPVAGVTVQHNGGLIGAVTDTNGAYAIGVPPGWNGTLTPSLGSFVFVPGTLSLTNVTASLTNQNFLMVTTIVPEISSSLNGTNLSLGWPGIPGVTYQAWASTNLMDWTIYGNAILGTNGPMQFVFPLDASPEVFFRVSASN